jgi:acylphosphatase
MGGLPFAIGHSPEVEARMCGASDERTVRVRIAGRVQGVGFRYWTEGTALGLRLAGWVRNRRDGSVEALFSGAADDVAEMLRRCHEGPRSAQVASVDVLEEGGDAPAGFELRPTA